MKKSKKSISILILLIAVMPTIVLAHPGKTDSSGCHYCKTNCAKYGLNDGEYHCHNGGSSSSSSSNSGSTNNNNPSSDSSNESNSSNNDNSNNTGSPNNTENSSNNSGTTNTSDSNNTTNENTSPKEEPKSNDNTLKTIIIDGNEINIKDNINYTTTNEKVSIKASTTDEKATYNIKNNDNLSIGENKVIIEVTAEDGTTKTYNINITREIILSSDTGIKVIIDDEEVVFENYKKTIYVSASTKNINIDYTLNDNKSKVEMNKLDSLKTGENKLKIKVIAEDGTNQEYEITIYKYSYLEDTIYTIISLGILAGTCYAIYYIIKKIKSKKKVA